MLGLIRGPPEHLNATPDLVGDTFAFLGSKKRDWLAGRFVAVCWDMPELMAREKEIVEKDALKFRMVMYRVGSDTRDMTRVDPVYAMSLP